MVLDPRWLDQIKKFEGFYAKPYWDARQWSVGYGSKASGPNDMVDRAEADRRLSNELGAAAKYVDQFAPNLDAGTRAALVSLTYNAGPSWMTSGLGRAIQAGDMDAARQSFLQYNKSEGRELPGLVSRRHAEANWFGQSGVGDQPQQALPASVAEPAQTRIANVPSREPSLENVGTRLANETAPEGTLFPFGFGFGGGAQDNQQLAQQAMTAVSQDDIPQLLSQGARRPLNKMRVASAIRKLGLTGV